MQREASADRTGERIERLHRALGRVVAEFRLATAEEVAARRVAGGGTLSSRIGHWCGAAERVAIGSIAMETVGTR